MRIYKEVPVNFYEKLKEEFDIVILLLAKIPYTMKKYIELSELILMETSFY